ncbi:hypothetical protein BLOT_005872 [Blomia tropicalis]|nr:hypothetical protein BLOT_005872 [Blomia tropicalis]
MHNMFHEYWDIDFITIAKYFRINFNIDIFKYQIYTKKMNLKVRYSYCSLHIWIHNCTVAVYTTTVHSFILVHIFGFYSAISYNY